MSIFKDFHLLSGMAFGRPGGDRSESGEELHSSAQGGGTACAERGVSAAIDSKEPYRFAGTIMQAIAEQSCLRDRDDRVVYTVDQKNWGAPAVLFLPRDSDNITLIVWMEGAVSA